METTKEIEIQWNGKPEIVVIKRLNFGEKNRLQDEATDIKVVGTQTIAKVSIAKINELSLLKGITKAPFSVDLATIQSLPVEIAEKLLEVFGELNGLSEKKIPET